MTRTPARTFALIASLVLLATSELARAGGATITSPAIYGGPDADVAYCAVRNVGRKPTSAELRIIDESGTPLVTTSQACNGTPQPGGTACLLEPEKICRIRADITTGFAYACSATGKTRSLRGSTHVGCCRMSAPSTSYRSAELR